MTLADKPLRADARRNRERILAAAAEVFARRGEAAQMDDVARAAGVGVGTVYRHFATKEDLIGELIRQQFEAKLEVVRQYHEVEDPWAALTGMMRSNAEEMAEDASQQKMLWSASDAAFERALPAQQELLAATKVLVDRARDAGLLREDFVHTDIPTVMCAIGNVQGMGHRGGVTPNWRLLLEIVIDGMRAR